MATVPAPKTWSVNEYLTAAGLNLEVRDALNFLLDNAPKCSIYQTASTNMPTSGTYVQMLFDTESYDNDSMHSTSTNPGRITFNTAGLYLVTWGMGWAANTTGNRFGEIRLNAAGVIGAGTVLDIARGPALSSGVAQYGSSFFYRASAADHIEMQSTQTSGGALASNPGLQTTKMQALWVGK